MNCVCHLATCLQLTTHDLRHKHSDWAIYHTIIQHISKHNKQQNKLTDQIRVLLWLKFPIPPSIDRHISFISSISFYLQWHADTGYAEHQDDKRIMERLLMIRHGGKATSSNQLNPEHREGVRLSRRCLLLTVFSPRVLYPGNIMSSILPKSTTVTEDYC